MTREDYTGMSSKKVLKKFNLLRNEFLKMLILNEILIALYKNPNSSDQISLLTRLASA